MLGEMSPIQPSLSHHVPPGLSPAYSYPLFEGQCTLQVFVVRSELFLGKTEHLVGNICDECRAKDLKRKYPQTLDECCCLWHSAYGRFASK